ncbi:MAG: hypothetical protein R2867_21670 [Caldilineaceae bacterium]
MLNTSILHKFSAPVKVGLLFGAIGVALTIVGIIRGNVPLHPASIGIALLIGGGVWFLVAWAVATAAADVDQDIATGADMAADPHAAE